MRCTKMYGLYACDSGVQEQHAEWRVALTGISMDDLDERYPHPPSQFHPDVRVEYLRALGYPGCLTTFLQAGHINVSAQTQ